MARTTKRARQTPPRRRVVPIAIFAAAVLALAGYLIVTRHNESPSESANPPLAAAPQPEVSSAPAIPRNHIYSETADPAQDIAAALHQAGAEHKRVLLDFGGDWCGDCQVLDLYFHQPPNSALLEQNFILVHVFIGHMDQHLDVPLKYNVPLKKGVPALAVLDAKGKLLYSQTSGEFENMRHMDSASVTSFLNRWKV